MTAGILPAALELLDRACMEVVDQAIHIGFPANAGAALIIELDGLNDGMSAYALIVLRTSVSSTPWSRFAPRTTAEEAARLWLSRRAAYGALARLAPTCYIVDGCVPRTKLPEALARTIDIGRRYGLMVANMAHAGDGNLHPSIPFDINDPDSVSARHGMWPRHSAHVCRPGGNHHRRTWRGS